MSDPIRVLQVIKGLGPGGAERLVLSMAEVADPDAAGVLQGARGVTSAATLPATSTLVEGAWWAADYAGPPLVSLEAEVARGLRLGVGDTIAVNVFGRRIEATVAMGWLNQESAQRRVNLHAGTVEPIAKSYRCSGILWGLEGSRR